MRIFTTSFFLLLPLHTDAIGQEKPRHVIADFEDEKFIEGKKASHESSVTLVEDVPEGGGKFSAKTAVEANAGTKNFVGTGFKIPATDFSKFGQIKFWIKADFESGFNFKLAAARVEQASFHFQPPTR